MLFFVKTVFSGFLIALISTVSKRYPGLGGLIASLPLLSVLGMIWLWLERPDAENMAHHVESTLYFVLPSLPMFALMPWMMRSGIGFWISLGAGCLLTIALYSIMIWIAPRFGIRL